MGEIPYYLQWIGLLFTVGAPSVTVAIYLARKHRAARAEAEAESRKDLFFGVPEGERLRIARDRVGHEIAEFLGSRRVLGDPLRVVHSITSGVLRDYALDAKTIPISHSLEEADRILAHKKMLSAYDLDELHQRAVELDVRTGRRLQTSEALIPLIASAKQPLQIAASTIPPEADD